VASFLVADSLSLARIPLGLAFIGWAGSQGWALGLVGAAALTDILDGWVARRVPPQTGDKRHYGDWLDPLCDKLFVAAVAGGLWSAYETPASLLALMMLREALQALAMVVYRTSQGLRREGPYNYRAGWAGKATTVAQFGCALAIVLGWHQPWLLAGLCAALGAFAVSIYVGRVRSVAEGNPAQTT